MQPYMDASDTLHFARVDFRNDTGVFGIKNETAMPPAAAAT